MRFWISSLEVRENSGRPGSAAWGAPAVLIQSGLVSDDRTARHIMCFRLLQLNSLRPVAAALFRLVVTTHRVLYRGSDSTCRSVVYAQSGPGFALGPVQRRQCKTRSAAHLFRADADESIVSRQAIDASKHRWHQARKSAIGAPERRGYAQKGPKQNDSSAAWFRRLAPTA